MRKMPLPDNDPINQILRTIHNITQGPLLKKKKFVNRDIHSYQSALASGRFDRASRILKGSLGGPIVGGGGWARATRILNWLKSLEQTSLNSPLLDLFGPVQMNEAMRKTRGSIDRRKYLVDEGA